MGNCVAMRRVPGSMPEAKCANFDNTECGSIETSASKNSASLRCPSSSELCFKPPRASFRDPGSLEETFFDSHPSLDSDYEDYFSINGDDTPAVNDASIARETSQLGRDLSADNDTKKTSPNKLLIDLFRGDNQISNQMSEAKPSNKPESKGSYVSMVSFACTRKTRSSSGDGKERKHGECCLPNLVRNLSIRERKKALSPA